MEVKMKAIAKLAVLVAAILCSPLCVSADNPYDVNVSAPTAQGNNNSPKQDSIPYSSGPDLPPVGQNCRIEKVCAAVSCTAYDNQGKCTNQQCVAWDERFVCK